MVEVDLKVMLEAGVHFGHQTRRWNPKMRPYIFTQRDGVHIIDLEQTVVQARQATRFITDVVAEGEMILFVGTKKQARDIIRQEAERVGQFYVTNRWLGGTLTNFRTIKASIDRLMSLYDLKEKGEVAKLTKKEGLGIDRTIEKLEGSLGGIKTMTKLPGAIFIVDPNHEDIAKREAIRLKIPVVAMIDTNGNPDDVDYPIVSNDDAIRSIHYITTLIANACAEGLVKREQILRERAAKAEKEGPQAKTRGTGVREQRVGGKGRAYTSQKPTEAAKAELTPEEVEAFAKAKAELRAAPAPVDPGDDTTVEVDADE